MALKFAHFTRKKWYVTFDPWYVTRGNEAAYFL